MGTSGEAAGLDEFIQQRGDTASLCAAQSVASLTGHLGNAIFFLFII
jgi:hypothetical protein